MNRRGLFLTTKKRLSRALSQEERAADLWRRSSNLFGRAILLRRRPRWRVRLQAGFSQPRRAAVASNKNIENNPMQSSRRAPAATLWGVILDTSGKSAALLHHRTIRETPASLRGTAAKAVDAHLRYLERDGVTSNGEKGRAYSADENEADGRSGQSGQGWSTNTRRLNHQKRC